MRKRYINIGDQRYLVGKDKEGVYIHLHFEQAQLTDSTFKLSDDPKYDMLWIANNDWHMSRDSQNRWIAYDKNADEHHSWRIITEQGYDIEGVWSALKLVAIDEVAEEELLREM